MNAQVTSAAKRWHASFDPQDFSHRVILYGLIIIVVIGLGLGFSVSWVRASSFALGGALSLLNFKWLKDIVDRAIYRDARRGGRGIALKFFLRYGLILMIFYGILRVSRIDLLCAFLGLFTTIGAIWVECMYQVVRSFVKN